MPTPLRASRPTSTKAAPPDFVQADRARSGPRDDLARWRAAPRRPRLFTSTQLRPPFLRLLAPRTRPAPPRAGRRPGPARPAFEQAATALEAVMAKGDARRNRSRLPFRDGRSRPIISLICRRGPIRCLTIVRGEDNFSPIERVLAQLMLRDLGALRRRRPRLSTVKARQRRQHHRRHSGAAGIGPRQQASPADGQRLPVRRRRSRADRQLLRRAMSTISSRPRAG